MDTHEKGKKIFSSGFNCAQSVVGAFAEKYGLSQKDAFRVAGSFGAGIGRLGLQCGAVTGALIVLGLRYGQTEGHDAEAKAYNYTLARECIARFTQRNGSIICKEILGCDLNTEEGAKIAREKNLFNTVCCKALDDAIDIVEGLIGS